MAVSVDEAKSLIADMCLNFYSQGWVSGTGGGISVKAGDKIVMAPSGVQKERMKPADMFVLDSAGSITETPREEPVGKKPKLSECSPLFMSAYELRGAGAVLHSHALEALMVTLIDETATEFRATQLEMIKGIKDHGFYDTLVVPIVENTAREAELTESLRNAMAAYPKTCAVLVRRHGVYIWGDTWVQAKTQAECYHYIFQAALEMRRAGIEASAPSSARPSAFWGTGDKRVLPALPPAVAAAKQRLPYAVVLDIEGTTTPITFVKNTLFPYAKSRLEAFLKETWATPATQASVDAVPAPARREALPEHRALRAAVEHFASLIDRDVKDPALKDLQGRIWERGYASGDIVGEVYEDVPRALAQWVQSGVKVYVYSSGSRQAQRLIFGKSNKGDLRPYFSGFFDAAGMGSKLQAGSYQNIAESIGVDSPADILFYTDIPGEAEAARAAGWTAALVVRPGNASVEEAELEEAELEAELEEAELQQGSAWGSEELQAFGVARSIPVVRALTASVAPAFQ